MKTLMALIALGVLGLSACEDGTYPVDPTWIYEWRVENLTDDSLRVAVRFKNDQTEYTIVTPGHVQIIVREEAFLGGPTSPSKAFSCVSAYRMSGDLVYQEVPVQDSSWAHRDIGRYEAQFTLVLRYSQLSDVALLDACGMEHQ